MQGPFDSGPAAPVDVAISDVPVAPVAVSFTSEPPAAAAAPRRTRAPASRVRRIAGWALDLACVAALVALHVLAATRLAAAPSASGMALAAPLIWMAVGAAVAISWSWVFVAIWARTPGMALTGQYLQRLDGTPLRPFVAFVRAVLSVLSAGLGLFGYVLALFDARRQTLHDKLCRCLAVVDVAARRPLVSAPWLRRNSTSFPSPGAGE